MKKTKKRSAPKKLGLARETIRTLDNDKLAGFVGGTMVGFPGEIRVAPSSDCGRG